MLVDRFLEDAIEVDVDAVRDATGEVAIGAVMEHVEEAGVHSGDSACVIPPPTLDAGTVALIERYTRDIAAALEVVGPLNVQFAVKQPGPNGGARANGDAASPQGQVYVIEANPRASRTVPFVSKATGVPLAQVAARVLAGATLDDLRGEGLLRPAVTGGHVSVKEAVLPFNRFPDADTLLGPEMRSTGEVMGIDRSFGLAFAKSQAAAGDELPAGGTVFFSLADRDKATGVAVARRFVQLGLPVGRHLRHRPVLRGRRGAGGHGRGQGERRGRGRRPARPVRCRCRRRGPDPGWQGRSGGQHPARPRPPGRRRLHPPGGQSAPGGLPDDAWPRPGPR